MPYSSERSGKIGMSRKRHDKRLKNVMNPVFSSGNIEDSKQMQDLTEAADRDSAGENFSQLSELCFSFLALVVRLMKTLSTLISKHTHIPSLSMIFPLPHSSP